MQDDSPLSCSFDYHGKHVEFVLPSDQDHISKHILQTKGFYELSLLEALSRALSPGDLVVDAGANIGNHTVFFAKILGCRVMSFEPVPDTCAVLRQNVSVNGLADRVSVHQTALGAAAATASIEHYDPGNIGGTQLALDPAGEIRVSSLDAIERDGRVRLLKIDVEGMDAAVLAGAKALLDEDRPWVVCEAKGRAEYEPIAGFLAELGYIATACFNATDTYVFLPARDEVERDALTRYGFDEIMQLQRDTRALGDRFAQIGRYAERLSREATAKAGEDAAALRTSHAEVEHDLSVLRASLTDLEQDLGRTKDAGRVVGDQLLVQFSQHSAVLDRLLEDTLHSREEGLRKIESLTSDLAAAAQGSALNQVRLDAALSALEEGKARLGELDGRHQALLVEKRETESRLELEVRERSAQLQAATSELAARERETGELRDRAEEQSEALRTGKARLIELEEQHRTLLAEKRETESRLELEVRDRNTQLQVAASELATREHELNELRKRAAAHVERQQRAETELAGLRMRLVNEANEKGRWQRLATSMAATNKGMEELLNVVSHSVTYQMGSAFLLAMKSPAGVAKLPTRLYRLMREMRRRGRQAAEGVIERRAVVPIRVPALPMPDPSLAAMLPMAEVLRAPDELEVLRSDDGASGPLAADPVSGSTTPRLPDPPRSAADLKLAVVMDEFTYSSYAPCCDVLQLSPATWREQLEAFVPDLLFIESAWQGKAGTWQGKIAHGSPELDGILEWCRQRRIPTAFWNKEDPVHFSTFIGIARRFDFVFTTDIDCIGNYKAGLGHERVYLLPFACQPRSHNPIEKYERKDAFCFAGAYYTRYPDRQRDFDGFIESLSLLAPLEIFDRNHGKDHPDYMFPERYRNLIQGSLPFDQIDLAYKGYRYAINLNSVKQSQTMFARRAFDLLGCNTLTISNYSRGLRLMFGDLVVATDSGKELLRRLGSMLGEANTSRYRRFRLAGLRKTLSEHTYQDRLSYILAKVSGRECRKPEPRIMVVARVGDEAELAIVLDNYDRQRHGSKRLALVITEGWVPQLPRGRRDILLLGEHEAAGIEPSVAWQDWFVAAFSNEDHYDSNYLVDMSLARTYADASAIGKAAYYRVADGILELVNDGSQYKEQTDLPLRGSMVQVDQVHGTLREFVAAIEQGNISTNSVLAIDEFNYVRGGAGGQWAEAADLPDLDVGLPIDVIQRQGEEIPPAVNPVPDGVMTQGPNALATLFAVPRAERGVRTEAERDGILIVSELPEDKHEYVYSRLTLPLAGWVRGGHIEFNLEVQPGVSLEVALVFLGADGTRMGSVVKPAGRNVSAAVPDGAAEVRLGLRVKGAGEAMVKRLVQGHVPSRMSLQLGRSRHLLLTNQYPSYDNIYRNGFVHRRVLGYREQGMHVDVFCLRNVAAAAYHEYEDVDVTVGWQEQLRAQLRSNPYQTILVHFLDAAMWSVLRDFIDHTRVIVWVHGSEVQPWHRRDFNHRDEDERNRAKGLSEARMTFWREVLEHPHPNLHLVFVSQYLADTAMEDVGVSLDPRQYSIIHNFIDGRLFAYAPKPDGQRLKVLSIRPYASRTYANDLSVRAIVSLRDHPLFPEMEFRLIGDGPLFEETVAPLEGLANVDVDRRFLDQTEIAALHREYGVFLCPSRMDSQGVSRDEAMASGLVPVTTRVAAIPEFVDEESALLADAEDWQGIADNLIRIAADASLFQRMSFAATSRVTGQSGKDQTILREVALIASETIPDPGTQKLQSGCTPRKMTTNPRNFQ